MRCVADDPRLPKHPFIAEFGVADLFGRNVFFAGAALPGFFMRVNAEPLHGIVEDLDEAATFAARFNPRIHAWYERKKAKSGVAKAKKALACKLAKAVWHVMNGEDFDEKLMFG